MDDTKVVEKGNERKLLWARNGFVVLCVKFLLGVVVVLVVVKTFDVNEYRCISINISIVSVMVRVRIRIRKRKSENKCGYTNCSCEAFLLNCLNYWHLRFVSRLADKVWHQTVRPRRHVRGRGARLVRRAGETRQPWRQGSLGDTDTRSRLQTVLAVRSWRACVEK